MDDHDIMIQWPQTTVDIGDSTGNSTTLSVIKSHLTLSSKSKSPTPGSPQLSPAPTSSQTLH